MKTFEESRFPERIVSNSGLSEMVRCTDSIPDASSTPEGTIYHLTSEQAEYQINHIYMCVVNYGVKSWKDLTENHDISPDVSGCSASGQLVLWDGIVIRLNAVWTSPEDDPDDLWEKDVLLRKLDAYPTKLIDGEFITSSINRNQYSTTANNYQSGPVSASPVGHTYKYRVFHVFGSGRLTYTDMPVEE